MNYFVRRIGPVFVVAVFLLGGFGSLQPLVAQQRPDQLRQLLELQNRSRELRDFESEEAIESILEDSADDIGRQEILRKPDEHEPYRILASVNERFTDNVALSPFTEESDFLTTVTAGFDYYPLEGRTKPLTLGVRQQFFRYGDNSSFDFDRLTLQARGTRQQPVFDVPFFFTGRYGYEEFRQAGSDRGDLIRSFHVVEGSIRYFHLLSLYEALIPRVSIEIEETQDLDGQTGTTADNEKNNIGLSVTYFNDYSRNLDLYGAVQYRRTEYDFVQTANGLREDDNGAVILGGTWSFDDSTTFTVNGYYGKNDSNGRTFEYEVLNLGGQFQLDYRF